MKNLDKLRLPKAVLAGILLFLFSGNLIFANPEAAKVSSPDMPLSIPQQAKITVSGTVSDAFGPVVGASVMEKGTTNGTVTDVNGNFSLSVSSNAVLVVSYIGFVTQEIPVNGRAKLEVVLREDTKTIGEIVVVGYGTQKKVNLTGSVSSVNIEEITASRPISNVSSALYGAAPGVYVNSGNNRPSNAGDATILVRGQGTLNNSSPLVIVDGAESSMSSVNPHDIASISILKDAASSAIYGSRAANGVVLITTRKGASGTTKIDYNGYVSFETLKRPYEVVSNYADYMGYLNEGLLNSNKPRQFSDEVIALWRSHENDANKLLYPNSNIFDVYNTGVSTQHNLSASGGTDKVTYFTSFNYLDNPGILENTGYKRYSLRSNLDAQLKSWLKVGTNLSGYTGSTPIISDAINDVYTYGLTGGNPGVAYKDEQNRLGINPNTEDDPQNATNNPFNRLRNTVGDIKTYNLKARIYGILTPFAGLTIQGSYAYEFWDETKTSKPNFTPMWNFQTGVLHTDGKGRTSIMNRDEKRFRNMGDVTARYEGKLVGDRLGFTIMAGASQEQFRREFHQLTRNDLLDPSLWAINGAIGETSSEGNITEWAMSSFFGRINLSWEDKYLLEANLRRDGSSRFQPDNRWGMFPSFSVGWRISEESFLKETGWLSNLKFRASYGLLGNNALGSDKDLDGNYSSQSTYAQTNYVLNRAVEMGLSQTALANAMLTWEKTSVTNIGVDFAVLKNRLSGSFEWFNKYTTDILIDVPAPRVHGNASLPKQNAAEVSNKGIELSLAWNDRVGTSGFNYNIGFNLTHITNKVEKFRGPDVRSLDGSKMTMEGYAYKTLYLLQVDRLVSTDQDLALVQSMMDNAPAGKTVFPYGRPQKGDFLYKDENGDGLINDEDRVAVGNGTVPDFMYGFTLGASWKGVDFSLLVQGTAGLKDVYQSNLYKSTVRMGYQLNKDVIAGRWYEGRPTEATYPRLLDYSDTRNDRVSDFWVTEKGYLKIRNIQLGYTLPAKWTKVASIEKLRIYGSLENFFTFTKWKGYDPEIDNVTYPTMREALVGINISF
ncbi:SusC/RagA family TonB-linked outer membrane protein [Bacteroidia bacterium]|nr:SusC/RagA family TonB-linked outer membrane protein [Bacteroidia bacterium]